MCTTHPTPFPCSSTDPPARRANSVWVRPGIRLARHGEFVVLLVGFALACPSHVSADLIYGITSYTTTGSVTGTITTNGTLGTIGLADITGWDITINIPSFAPVTLDPSNSGGAVNPADSGLTATSAALYLTPATTGSSSFLTFLESATGPAVKWLNVGLSTSDQSATLNDTTQIPFIAGSYNADLPMATTVPEPSTLVVAVLGSVSGLAWGWACRCRQKRRQRTVGQTGATA
jgi:hypothetical protein